MPTTEALQYSPYRNPYAGFIAELMLRGPQYQAEAAREAAYARARALEIGGQGAAQIAGTIGQSVGDIIRAPQQMQQQRMAQEQHNQALQLQGLKIQEAQGSLSDAASARTRMTQQEHADGVAQMGYALVKTGHSPDAVTAIFDEGIKKGLITAEEAQPFKLLAVERPEAIQQRVGPYLLSQAPWGRKLLEETTTNKPGDVVTNTLTGVPVRTVPEKVAPEPPFTLSAGQQRFSSSGELLASVDPLPNPAHAETARHNQAMEGIQRMQVGREAAANRETARHNQAMEQANNPLAALTGGAAGMPATPGGAPSNVTGTDVLSKLPPPVASQVKALAEGRMAFPAGFALKSPYWQSMISLVSQYDPSFDAINYNARSKTRADFTSGKSASQVNALNTVIGHLDDLSKAADALNNTWSPTWNTLANAVSTATGNPSVKKFETIQTAVSAEATRVWRQSGGTEADIQAWNKDLAAAGSPAQLHGVIATIGDLLASKLDAMQNQYQQGMGTADVKMITPQADRTLQRLRTKAGTAPPAGASGPTVGSTVLYQGKSYRVKGIQNGQAELEPMK